MKALAIESYIKDLGSKAAALDLATLVGAGWCVLNGRGLPELKDQVVATIAWQEAQMLRVHQLLQRLARGGGGLITDIVDADTAHKIVVAQWEEVLVPLAEDLREFWQGHVRISFNEADGWLYRVLAYNQILYPETFDVEKVKGEVVAFFS
ncbi:hypothetical protein N7481_005321 [Penicillium waksmanii]|uniref:uncharacterized protein n=1 Tax=Penicillium waksmanii TaxID=69791 RepID=UPI002547D2B2|nr:uncharacterized protein N7481_005321 [Penicillium waksmanii]KAJ5983222.1 hypothetical protein N7481_005321 [Penicillium waksmanii]